MKKLLIATHGYLADGFKSSISLLTGGEDAIETICAYVDESDYTERIQTFIDSIGEGDDGVIFTDIYGGSVCQKVALAVPGGGNVFHISGCNLGLIIEVLFSPGRITKEGLQAAIETARSTMKLVDTEGETPVAEGADDDFFD